MAFPPKLFPLAFSDEEGASDFAGEGALLGDPLGEPDESGHGCMARETREGNCGFWWRFRHSFRRNPESDVAGVTFVTGGLTLVSFIRSTRAFKEQLKRPFLVTGEYCLSLSILRSTHTVTFDIFSRRVVGWKVVPGERADLARMIVDVTFMRQDVGLRQLGTCCDRSARMASKTNTHLLADPGVRRSFLRSCGRMAIDPPRHNSGR